MSQSPLAWPSVGGRCSQLSSRRWLPPLRALLQRRRGVLTPILTVTGSQRGLPYPVESVQGPPSPQSPSGVRGRQQAECKQAFGLSHLWDRKLGPLNPGVRINAQRYSKPSKSLQPNCQIPPSTLCPRGAGQTSASSALLPGLQPQAGAQTSRVPPSFH